MTAHGAHLVCDARRMGGGVVARNVGLHDIVPGLIAPLRCFQRNMSTILLVIDIPALVLPARET